MAAEVTSTFSHRLSPLNMTVRELTGDMQLSRNELEETQVLVKLSMFGFAVAGCISSKWLHLFLGESDDSDNTREMGCHYSQKQ